MWLVVLCVAMLAFLVGVIYGERGEAATRERYQYLLDAYLAVHRECDYLQSKIDAARRPRK